MTTPETTITIDPTTVAAVKSAVRAESRPMAAPSFAEQMLAVLPDHAHVDSRPLTWSATWTTPAGTWMVSRKTDLLTTPVVKVVGPYVKITERPGNARRIIAVLRAFDALPADPGAMREAASPTAANEAEGGLPAELQAAETAAAAINELEADEAEAGR